MENHHTGSLKLAFSKAADYDCVDSVFESATKQKLDPQNYIARRTDEAFRKAIDEGAACMLTDETGKLRGLTIAYRVSADDGPDHHFTEFGTSVTSLPGYHSTRLIIAALAISEFLHNPPKTAIVADIKKANGASLKTYRDALGWLPLEDCELSRQATEVTDKTVASEQHKSKPGPDGLAPDEWHICDAATIAIQARVLLQFMDAGGITNRRTGDFIPVDFSALTGKGMDRPAIERLACN